jgi:transcriptional regulator with XRE-family HTH domain
MSSPFTVPAGAGVVRSLARLAATAGDAVRTERLRQRITQRELAARSGVSPAVVAKAESGAGVSLETYVRLAEALGLRPDIRFDHPRRRQDRSEIDLVHAAMGECEVARLRSLGHEVRLDHPFQHYHFAGRADVLAWNLPRHALLHIENRTRFPDLQDAAGAYNAKREYLPGALADRLPIRGGWRSVTHVMAGLWSAEVIHTVRLRVESFRALCPNGTEAFEAWWSGDPPIDGLSSAFVLLDPRVRLGRARRFVGLAEAMATRPRFHGYAAAAEALRRESA